MPPVPIELQHKTFEIKIAERRKDGGRIVISTGSPDRDHDRVFPTGLNANNYLKNPIVQWGHNYREPWSTIGRTKALDVTAESIAVDFDLRPPANEQDPQNIVRLLWEGDWVKTASIGFIPKAGKPNDFGGTDFTEWELLEWSLVPVPANAEALRLAVKSLDDDQPEVVVPALEKMLDEPVIKRGRVLSAKNEGKIKAAHDSLGEVLAEVQQQPEADDGNPKGRSEDVSTETAPDFDFHGPDLKGAIPSHETPKADPEMAWDGPHEVSMCPAERGPLRRMHAWVDSDGDPAAKQSYKLPHHLVDGRVVLRGVNNAKARLPQSSIPAADHAGVEAHLSRHQAQFEKSEVMRDFARALSEAADEMDGHNHLDADDERDLAESLQILLDHVKEMIR